MRREHDGAACGVRISPIAHYRSFQRDMPHRLEQVTLLVHDYDAAIAFFTVALGFELLEDTDLGGGKRWVRVAPRGSSSIALLLARASTPAQARRVGDQTGGRVGFFLYTDDFARDHALFSAAGVRFQEAPRVERYGTVAVFEDLYGNRWDLIDSGATDNADRDRT